MYGAFSHIRAEVVGGDVSECLSWWNYDNINSPYARLYSILEGEGSVEHSGKVFRLIPGKVFIIPAHTLIQMRCRSRMLQRWLHFRAWLPNGIDLFQVVRPAYEMDVSDLPEWTPQLLDKAWELFPSMDETDHLELVGILRILIAQALRAAPEQGGAEERILALTRFKAAFELIEAGIDGKVTLGRLARSVGLHPTYFSNEFKRRFGMSPMRHLCARRIECAKELLANPETKMAEIAGRTGFRDAFHFSRTFKRLTGLNPSEYRSQALLKIS